MKTKLKHIIGLAAILLAGITLQAQTNSDQVPDGLPPLPQVTPEQFPLAAFHWLTEIDHTKSWTNIDLEISTGYKQVTGVGASSDLSAQYDIGRWNVGGWIQFSGVGSPINSGGVQGGYALIQDGDVKLETDLRAGYGRRLNDSAAGFVVEPCVFLTKLMTKNTFSRIGISLPEDTHRFNSTPTFYIEAGFGHLK